MHVLHLTPPLACQGIEHIINNGLICCARWGKVWVRKLASLECQDYLPL